VDSKLKNKITQRIEEGTLRSLSLFTDFTDFYSNDYLGLSQVKLESKVGAIGSTGSRLISGNSIEAIETEKYLADFFKTESALVFNSGYDANLGFFSTVPQRGDVVLYDEYVHASIRDGIRLSFAESFAFKHNEVSDLKKKLDKQKGTIYVVVESLYSMDGDLVPLQEVAQVCSGDNVYLIVDEAHACGVFGNEGRGLVNQFNLEDKVFARVVTFGKAYGLHGACVLGSSELIAYLYNFARSFIYTTALPPEAYLRIQKQIEISRSVDLRNKLRQNISALRKVNPSFWLSSASDSPIQMLRLEDLNKLKLLAVFLQENKIAVKPIYHPTVPKGKEGIRVCVHSFNTTEEITYFNLIVSQFFQKY
jgi:8-amino-7-oxononanoate synthase